VLNSKYEIGERRVPPRGVHGRERAGKIAVGSLAAADAYAFVVAQEMR
jgi:hypothetical protein